MLSKWNLLIYIFYITIFNLFFISSKNLQYIEDIISNEELNVTCPEKCKDGLCDNITLKCDSCIDGYYTAQCTDPCPTINCLRCVQDSGECEECKNNLKLIDNFCCEQNCDKCNEKGCLKCSENTKYGINCIDCPSNCFYDETGLSRKCEQNTGNCYSCISGKKGQKCNDNCSKGCNLEISNCDMNDGSCICLDGYYGTTCNGECDPNCIKCDNISGTCYQCKEGYYPKDKVCYSCPENCDGECPGGICIKCKKGFYGDICNETCSIYCVNNTCDKKDGLCDCINYFWRESHCTKCINHFDLETKCTECIKHYDFESKCAKCVDFYDIDKDCTECINYFDIKSNCTNCLNHFDRKTNCSECINFYDKDTKCSECINNFDIQSDCAKCLNYFDLNTNCTKCLNKFDLDSKCTECLYHYDFQSNCTICSNHYDIKYDCTNCSNFYDIEKDCKECIQNYNESTECTTCINNYNLNDHCETCLNYYDINTSCQYCLPNFDPETNCTNCFQNYDLSDLCHSCINHFSLETNCTNCTLGFYGEQCDTKCSEGCNTNVSNCEKEDGKCEECLPLYYGEKCEKKSNVTNCTSVDRETGLCINCEETFYLKNNICEPCSSNCSKSLCKNDTGECFECENLDSWGVQCENTCSKFCEKVPEDQYICIKEDGVCREGCIASGHFSDKKCTECEDRFYPRAKGCTESCSSNCKDDICDKEDGSCESCNDGFFGERCETKCNEKCKTSCKKENGKCNDCIDGYYRDEESTESGCSQCPKDCFKCLDKEQCTECYSGKYGQTCQLNCSSHCQEPLCDLDGNCPCSPKYYGDQCAQECAGCYDNGCDDHSGDCKDHFCLDKFYDPRKCNNSCAKNCSGDGRCDLFTGECIKCEGNKWGNNCEKKCENGCDSDERVDCCYVKNTTQKGIKLDIIESNNYNNKLKEEQSQFYFFYIKLGGYDLKILADFETNSPLVIFDNGTEIKKTDPEIYNINIDTKYNSTNSSYYIEGDTFVGTYLYDGFSLVKGKTAKDRLILRNHIFDNFTFLICQEFKIEKEFDDAGKINGIVGLGLRNYFTENLFYSDNNTGIFPKNIIIKSIDQNKKKSIYIGDYNGELRQYFSKLSTMLIDNNKSIAMNTLITYETSFTGIAYSLRKAYQYEYDIKVTLNNRIETTIVFNNLYKQFFEKIYFGDLFDNGCYFRSLQGGEIEYYCDINKKQAIQSLPKLGLILGNYIYYLSYDFLYKESGQFITFIIKLHGQSQQKIELGKSFFNEFSVVYNNGNETLNFFGDIKKLNVPLKDPSSILNMDSDIFTPGGWVTLIVFVTAVLIIICYLSKYCFNKNEKEENEEDEDEDDDELLIDDTLE